MPATAPTRAKKDAQAPNPTAPAEKDSSGGSSTVAAASPSDSKRRPLKLVGLVAAIVLLAYAASSLAVPAQRSKPRFAGPFTTELFPDKYQVNLSGGGMKRFLQFTLSVIYDAYDEAYVLQRTKDPLYDPYLQSTVLSICSAKTVEEVQGRANKDALMEELRAELDGVLFPVHVGATALALEIDPESGLRPGLSHDRSTFRGTFHDHLLTVDEAGSSLRLGEGPPVIFEGHEIDLVVTDAEGETLYLDVTRLVSGFSGTVQVGVHGRIRRILPKYLLVQ